MKQMNPYTRLLSEIKEWCHTATFRHEKLMWYYSVNRLNESFNLSKLYERVRAAEQLGYDVLLVAKEDSLDVVYKKKLPGIPFEWQ